MEICQEIAVFNKSVLTWKRKMARVRSGWGAWSALYLVGCLLPGCILWHPQDTRGATEGRTLYILRVVVVVGGGGERVVNCDIVKTSAAASFRVERHSADCSGHRMCESDVANVSCHGKESWHTAIGECQLCSPSPNLYMQSRWSDFSILRALGECWNQISQYTWHSSEKTKIWDCNSLIFRLMIRKTGKTKIWHYISLIFE